MGSIHAMKQLTLMESKHAHRWRIEEPDGRNVSPGTCVTCGAEKEFRNWFDEDPKVWNRTVRK